MSEEQMCRGDKMAILLDHTHFARKASGKNSIRMSEIVIAFAGLHAPAPLENS